MDGERQVLQRSGSMRTTAMRVMVVSCSAVMIVCGLDLRSVGVLVAEGVPNGGHQRGVPIGTAFDVESDVECRGERTVALFPGFGRVQLRVEHGRNHEAECRESGEKPSDSLATG
jgi:hypothetical protein